MKKTLLWILSLLITLSFAIYQRKTGPTYPVKGTAVSSDGKFKVNYKLLRSCTTGAADCRIDVDTEVHAPVHAPVEATLKWRRYKTEDQWEALPYTTEHSLKGMSYSFLIPSQPPAGKVEYLVSFKTPAAELSLSDKPVVARFKGAVPGWVLTPHIVLMFLFMLFSVRIFLTSAFGAPPVKHSVPATFLFLLGGGFVFGPITQQYAFGQAWTGFPFGYDLTDNKTLLMLLAWLPALWAVLKDKPARLWLNVAFAVTAAVYLVPHSLFGSELDYKKGEVVTGK